MDDEYIKFLKLKKRVDNQTTINPYCLDERTALILSYKSGDHPTVHVQHIPG